LGFLLLTTSASALEAQSTLGIEVGFGSALPAGRMAEVQDAGILLTVALEEGGGDEHEAEHESQWAAIKSIAEKIGCTAETLRKWVRQDERDSGRRAGLTTKDRERMKELERENRELRRTNEILRKASAYFAQAELDRRRR
jgi:transposase-like protein